MVWYGAHARLGVVGTHAEAWQCEKAAQGGASCLLV